MPRLTARSYLVFALAVTAAFIACGPQRQQPGTLPVGPLGDTDPIAAMIERRPELQLVDTQVSVLRIIKRELDRVNRPLREELEKLGLLRPVEIGAMRRTVEAPTKEQQEKAKPFVDQIRDNNRRARDAALEVLNATQRARLDSLERRSVQRREQGQRRRPR
jgi:hypothetical protein